MSRSGYWWRPIVRLVSLAALLGAAATRARRLLLRVAVEGPSMIPTLAPGDRLVVLRTPVLEEGDVVALRDPEDENRTLVKRVDRLHAEEIAVRGDNPGASRDSRQFGPVARRLVLGRAVYRYHPIEHAGRLRRDDGR